MPTSRPGFSPTKFIFFVESHKVLSGRVDAVSASLYKTRQGAMSLSKTCPTHTRHVHRYYQTL